MSGPIQERPPACAWGTRDAHARRLRCGMARRAAAGLIDAHVLESALARLPRVALADLPTPLHDAPRLARAVGVASLRVKRDDLTGLALGGNKTRQLEYVLGDALAHGATAIITAA